MFHLSGSGLCTHVSDGSLLDLYSDFVVLYIIATRNLLSQSHIILSQDSQLQLSHDNVNL